MTLNDVLPAIRQLSASEKLKLIRILAEDLEVADNIAPLEPFKTYDKFYLTPCCDRILFLSLKTVRFSIVY